MTMTSAVRPARSTAAFSKRLRGLGSERARLGMLGLLAFALVWEVAARLELVHKLFLPPMTSILAAGWELYASGFIWPHIGYTLGNFTVGFVLGVVLGIPVGLAMGWRRRILYFLDPVVSIGLATPVIALVPLVIAVFGIFWQSKVAITTIAVFFPVLVGMLAGVQGADAGLIKVARSFQASDLKIMRDIILPGSVPSLVGGLRLGLARGLVGELAAEFFGAPQGLGAITFQFSAVFQADKMFVAILTMALIGVAITEVMKVMQDRADAWRPEQG